MHLKGKGLVYVSKLVKQCRAYRHYMATDKIADQGPGKLNTAAVRKSYYFANVPICNGKKQGCEKHVHTYQ